MDTPQSEYIDKQEPPGELHFAPSTFQDFAGQGAVKTRLQLAMEAAIQRKEALGHVLLIGPPDFGKATLARIVCKNTGGKVTTLNGLTCGKSLGDFAGVLTSLEENDVVFIEDIHALDKNVAEFLCQPMKDFTMQIVIESGINARGVRLNLPAFNLIATASRRERMSPGFLSSFQIVEEMEPYTQEELATIAHRLAGVLGLDVDERVAEQVASASCISPRDVLNRLRHLRDYVHIKAHTQRVTVEIAREGLKMLVRARPASESSQWRRSRIESELSVDPLKRRYQVFVSSTYEDLKEERRHVMQALLETKCIPTGMELFPAASEDQWKLISRVIDDCDYYVVVVAGRYGSQSPEGKSYTEMEFDYAVSSGKSVIGFYHSDPDSLPGSKLEKGDEQRRRLAAFTEKVKQRMCKPWSTPEGLASAIKSAILYAIEQDRKPGWIRASDLPSTAAIAVLKESMEPRRRSQQWRLHSGDERPIEIPVTVKYHEVKNPAQGYLSSDPGMSCSRSLLLLPSELFLILGPRLGVKRPRRTLKMFLEEQLVERIESSIPTTADRYLKGISLTLGASALDRILDPLIGDKFVKCVRPPAGVTTKVPYWEITPRGQQRLAELRVAGAR